MASSQRIDGPALNASRAQLIVLLFAAVVIALDQWTKALAVANLSEAEPVEVLGWWLRLHLTHNSGAAFSFLTGKTWVFTAISTLVSTVIIWKSREIRHLGWAIATGAVLGGAIGNLIDRYTNAPSIGMGRVVDFLEIPYWPIFNIADLGVFFGCLTLVALSLKGHNWNGATPRSEND